MRWAPLAAMLLLPACADEKTAAPAAAPAALQDEVALPPLDVPEQPIVPPAGLAMSSLPPAAGFLLPEATTKKGEDDNTESYVVGASLEDVIAFYRKRGYEVERNPAGATVHGKDGEGLMQVLANPNRSLELLVFTRTREPPDRATSMAGVDPDNPDIPTAKARSKAREQILEDLRLGRKPSPEALRQIPQ